MRHEPVRHELREVVRDVVEAFAIQLRAQREMWAARGDQACLAALGRLLEHRPRVTDPNADLEAELDRARQDLLVLARELERAAVVHGKPSSRTDSLARRAILDLLTAFTDLEDELFEARECAEERCVTGA